MAGDLHTHSKISDGSLGLEDLVTLAKRCGLTALAITDHDTVAGATRAVNLGKRAGILVIHGVEFSTTDTARGNKAHILCYMADAPDRLEGLCRKTLAMRKRATLMSLQKVMRYYPITPEMVMARAAGSACVYKSHIMNALCDAGYADSIYEGAVYERLFGKDGVARVTKEYPDVREVIAQIHEAGGLAVLAHTAAYDNNALLEELTEERLLDGVQVWHPDHGAEMAAQLASYADEHGLLKIGGSDFHGMYAGCVRPLGCATTPDGDIEKLIAYKKRRMQ